ncbi:E3 ubiquitin-protein ligase MARCH5, partial [Antrostomus carolinensis]
RSCWVCFATDEDDRTAEWVRPCRCRGSTKWVHQTCLQRWVDEKQRGNSTARVACPQCNAEYLIVFPKLGKSIWVHQTSIMSLKCLKQVRQSFPFVAFSSRVRTVRCFQAVLPVALSLLQQV